MESQSVLKIKRLSNNAYMPRKGSALAAGFDLFSAYDYIIPRRGKAMVKTDLQVQVPDSCYGRIAPRSGLAWNSFIDVGAGVVDRDYRGELCVILYNFGNDTFKVNKGDRIAQLICERIEYPELKEVESLDDTERGSNGFGSTGVKHIVCSE